MHVHEMNLCHNCRASSCGCHTHGAVQTHWSNFPNHGEHSHSLTPCGAHTHSLALSGSHAHRAWEEHGSDVASSHFDTH